MKIFKFILMLVLFFIGMVIAEAGVFSPILIGHAWRMSIFTYALCLGFFLSWLYEE